MKISVRRFCYTLVATIGKLFIQHDDFTCFTIEDVARARGVKIPKETAIPAGTYRVIMSWSPRHNSMQPEILNVPLFTGVRFDIANYASQLEGCTGVGAGRGVDAVWNSAQAHKILCEKIQAAEDRGELVWAEFTDEQGAKL